jgi:hypothetical protein
LIDVVAPTREGRLYAWEQTGTLASIGSARLQWPTFARDAHRTGNLNSGVLLGGEPAGCTRLYRGVISKATAKYGAAAADDKLKVKTRANLGGLTLDPTGVAVEATWGTPTGAVYTATIPAGSFDANAKNTSFKFVDRTLTIVPGIKKVGIKLKKGVWEIQIQAATIDAAIAGDIARVFLRVGDVCIDRSRACELKPNGKTLVCR